MHKIVDSIISQIKSHPKSDEILKLLFLKLEILVGQRPLDKSKDTEKDDTFLEIVE